jgi:hypothetical protein
MTLDARRCVGGASLVIHRVLRAAFGVDATTKRVGADEVGDDDVCAAHRIVARAGGASLVTVAVAREAGFEDKVF